MLRDVMVLGERSGDLAAALGGPTFDFSDGPSARLSGNVPMDGPLLRAMFRAEAELLLADAEAMANGSFEYRTPEQRRADAFVLMAERLGEVADAWRSGRLPVVDASTS